MKISAFTREVRALASALLLIVFAGTGWSQSSAPPTGPEQIGRWVVETVWNRGDFTFGDRMFTPNAVLHYRGQNIPLTRESGERTVRNWRTGFPDFHFSLEDLIVQGNKVVMRIPFTGTYLGRFQGVAPTGKKISVTETLILRLENDRIAEMWEDYDEYGMRIQLGLIKAN